MLSAVCYGVRQRLACKGIPVHRTVRRQLVGVSGKIIVPSAFQSAFGACDMCMKFPVLLGWLLSTKISPLYSLTAGSSGQSLFKKKLGW